ncbi:MAG: DUF389 domain-containing protein [Flavobacterium sp.]
MAKETRSTKRLVIAINLYLKDILDISEDTNREATIEEVKSGISMKGQAAWVLIFSILIASAGLNTSSTAVVIGAMLISPLMGPILGLGMSLGINDMDLMRRAIKNFGVMVSLGLITSFLFFSIPIFQNETPELRARTYPDVRDVIIAFAGGLALIVALSRRTKQFNTIAGVAIATALMPPLCTAGYGLATQKWDFFGGALFLFTINTIFIALATFAVVRFLQFPVVEYVNQSKRKRISQLVYLVSFAIIVPSIYMFYELYKKSDFEQKAEKLISDFKSQYDMVVLDKKIDIKSKTISFATIGKSISNEVVEDWKSSLENQGYENVIFDITQNAESLETQSKLDQIEKTYLTTQQLLNKKDELLNKQERDILDLQKQINITDKSRVPFDQIAKEVKINYSNIQKFSFAKMIETDFKTYDTIPVFYIQWRNGISEKNKDQELKRIQAWLKVKLQSDKIKIYQN